MHFNSFPGAHFSYSGGGFTTLQLFLEQVIKTSYPNVMRDTVLHPLDMTRSDFGTLPPGEQKYAKAHYTACTEADAQYHRFVELAAAGLWTTPSDLLKAISAVQASLHTDSGFLKQDTARRMITLIPQTDTFISMALGWSADASVFSHGGDNDPGYRCYVFGSHGGVVNATSNTQMSPLPSRDGLAIMTTSAKGWEVNRKLVSAVFYLKGWPRWKTLPSYFGRDDLVPYAASNGTAIDDDWKQWIGQWQGEWDLVDDDGPKLAFESFSPMALQPAAAPTRSESGAQEHMFVVNGFETAVRLTYDGEARVLELIQVEGARTMRRR